MMPEKKLNAPDIEVQIVELVRLEFEIEQDLSKLHQDLDRVRQQRGLLEAQLQLLKKGNISPEAE